MNRIHALAVAAILAIAAGFGFVAATRTVGAHSASSSVSSAAISARAHKLNHLEASLRRALRDKPPALPAVPGSRSSAAVAAPRVVYHRPAPIVVLKHRSSSETEHESEHGPESDD